MRVYDACIYYLVFKNPDPENPVENLDELKFKAYELVDDYIKKITPAENSAVEISEQDRLATEAF